MDLGTAFAHSVARAPGRQASFQDGAGRRSYAAWYGEIKALAGGLAGAGLEAGDTLALVMRNRHEMASLYWAAQLLGLVFAPLSWRGTAAEIAHCLADCGAGALALDDAAGSAAGEAAVLAGLPGEAIITIGGGGEGLDYDKLLEARPLPGPVGASADQVCLMLYTSGTTGRPKGVPRSHAMELAASVSHIAHNRYRFGQSALAVMPMFHIMGIRVLVTTALLNGKLVLLPDYSPEAVLALIEAEAVDNLFLVPTMFHDVLADAGFGGFDLGSLAGVGYAGMAMTPALIEGCLARLKPDRFVNYYGSSEIYTFTYCDHLDRKPGSAGRAGLNQQIRVIDTETGHDLGPNELGEPSTITGRSTPTSTEFPGIVMRTTQLLTTLFVAVTSAASAQVDTTTAETVSLSFGWPAGLSATVARSHMRVSTLGAFADTTGGSSRYQMVVSDHSEGTLVDFFDFEILELDDFQTDYETEMTLAKVTEGLVPSFIVGAGGEIVRVSDFPALRSTIDDLLGPDIQSLPDLPPGGTFLLDQMLSEAVFTAGLRDEWAASVEFWNGQDLEIGATYEYERPSRPPGTETALPFLTEFGVGSREPCAPGGADSSCVLLWRNTYPRPDILQTLSDNLGRVMRPDTLADFRVDSADISTSVVILADPDGLILHRVEIRRHTYTRPTLTRSRELNKWC